MEKEEEEATTFGSLLLERTGPVCFGGKGQVFP